MPRTRGRWGHLFFGLAVTAVVAILVTRISCAPASVADESEDSREPLSPTERYASASDFLSAYSERYLDLRRESAEADWALNTRIISGDTTGASRSQRARLALAEFGGSAANLSEIDRWSESSALTELDRRQLESMLRAAAEFPESAGEAVGQRVRLETAQVETLFGYDFRLGGRSVSTNELDAILRASTDLALREAAWSTSKDVGAALRPGVLRLTELRNRAVREVGFSDYYDFKAAGYGLDREGIADRTEALIEDIWPLYRELHTWARYELAARYDAAVPDFLPAHWLPDRWGQDWSPILGGEGAGLDDVLAEREAEWIVREAERFYRSLGFEPLPESFWDRSSMYPAPADAPYRKNNHASAWHIDLDRDVRTLMSVEPNARWYETTHHELGHIYYYLSYANDDVPPLLRTGANRAFHEAIGSLLGLAATQDRFLEGRGLLSPPRAETERLEATSNDATVRPLLREALRFVAVLPWSAGVMTRYESELYDGVIDERNMNGRWWELKKSYQGIVPPGPRGEQFADAASKTHITNDPAEYYDYAFSIAILFQLHDRIATEILEQDPHDTDYWGSTTAGDFLREIMEVGATRPWEDVLRDATGESLGGDALVEYFSPLLEWLRVENAGRRHTLPNRLGGPA